MKTKLLVNNLRLGLFTLFLLIFSVKGFSQACTGNQLTVNIQNVTNPTSTTVEFDVYINNTGSTVIKLAGFTGNVRYPNNGWAAAATISAVILPAATGNFPGLSGFPTLSNTPASGQLRWTNTPFLLEPTSVVLPPNTNLMFCRLRLTNPVAWAPGTAGNLYLSTGGAGISTNVGTVYCSGNTNSTSISLATSTLILGSPANFLINNNTCFTTGSFTQTPVTCFGGTNGTATITMNPIPTNLNATYILDGNPSTPVTLSATGEFTLTGLSAGPHTLSVTGSGSCTTAVDVPFTIGGPVGPLTNITTITTCDSYTWSVTGVTYTASGTQTGTTVNGSGCTVNETLNLTINNSTSNTTTVTACDTYTWALPLGNGQTYTTSQTGITNVTTNGAGCPNTETLNLTIIPSPVTTPYSVCQGGTVSGGLVSTLGGGSSLPNYSGDNTGGPTYNRAVPMNQGGTCFNSNVGTAVQYTTHNFVAPASGSYVFSMCGNATWDTVLALYQAPFNPAGLCAGNTLIEAGDDDCPAAAQSEVTVTLVQGTAYTLVVSGYSNTDAGAYTITSTSPVAPPSVEWYTTPTLGSAIATGSPFNPVGVAGSGITDTNTVGATTFYAQFPGSTCRTPAVFTVTSVTPTVTTVSACDSYTWAANGTTYTTSGTYTSSSGCATNTLNLTINTTVDTPTTIAACDSYTWPVNGQTYTTSGVYTVPFTPQSGIFNTLASWNSTAAANGATVASNPLSGLALTGTAVNVTINGVAVNMTSGGSGMYVAPTFVGGFTANQPLTMTFTPPAYGVGGNYYLTNASDAIITGNLTVTYSDGTIDSAPVTNDTDFFGFFKNTGITSIVIVPVITVPNVNRFVSLKNLNVAVVPPCQTSTLNLTITPTVTPTFTQVAPICSGATLAALPTTSNNGVEGTWAPAISNTATTTYTFTPTSGVCTSTATMTIVVNAVPVLGTFGANPFPVCAGTSTTLTANVTNFTPTVTFGSTSFSMSTGLFGVPLTSPLSALLVDTASLGCTAFTPGSLTGKIALIQRGTCAFAIKAQNAQDAGAIGVLLYNNVAGAIVPAGTAPTVTIPVYGISLADGLALIAAMTAGELAVTLSPSPPLTYLWSNGSTISSTVTGILNANTDFTVTVTNPATGCSTTTTVTVPVTANTIPTFTQVAPICSGGTLAALPTTSDNSIAGTWAPALNNLATTTYTFTPTPVTGQCLANATMTIEVTPLTTTGSVTTSICAGDSYTWPANGVTYTTAQSGVTVVTGCNTATLNLTITPATTTGSVTTSICAGGSYTWPANGVTYTTAQSGVTVVTGCNTATLTLTVTPTTTTGSVTTSICAGGSYTWPANGVTYTTAQSGVTVVTGCNTATLNLTVTPLTTTGSVTTSICAGGSYTWPANGVTYTTAQSGVTVVTGCNTATLNLTVTPATTTGSVTTSICAGSSYTWPANGVTYTTAQSGVTVVTGCNTATLNLTINTAPTPTGSAAQSFSVTNLNNATIASLVVSPAGVIWYATLLDAQNGTNPLPSTTVITNGSTYWAVNVVGGCRSTPFAVAVSVTLGNEDFDNLNFSFYPNPTSSILNISYSRVISDILVFNMLGQEVMKVKTNESEVQIDLSQLAEATYFVKVTSEGREKIIKVIKRN